MCTKLIDIYHVIVCVSRKVRKIELNEGQREQLTKCYHDGKSHAFRNRCQIVLLKSKGRTSKDISKVTGTVEASVNHWLNRFESEGVAGLTTRAGRGRKPILNNSGGEALKICETVKQERQRLSQAREILEKELDKNFSLKTLKRFLKSITAATNG